MAGQDKAIGLGAGLDPAARLRTRSPQVPQSEVTRSSLSRPHGSAIHHLNTLPISCLRVPSSPSTPVVSIVVRRANLESVNENGDENGLRVVILSISLPSIARSATEGPPLSSPFSLTGATVASSICA